MNAKCAPAETRPDQEREQHGDGILRTSAGIFIQPPPESAAPMSGEQTTGFASIEPTTNFGY